MTGSSQASTHVAPKSAVIERTYSAPRDLVFSLFTDPAHLTRWWVPFALTNPVCEFDARPGGSIRFVMEAPDGTRFNFIGTVHEVDCPSRLVFSTIALNHAGARQLEVLQTISFVEKEGQTVVRIRIKVVSATVEGLDSFTGMEGGWMQDLARLEFHLLTHWSGDRRRRAVEGDETALTVTMPSDREIMVTRTFDAPRAAVYAALTDPAMFPIWWKPSAARDAPESAPIASSGEYAEVTPQELVVNAFDLLPREGYPGLDAVHLHEVAGKTRLTGVSLFPTRAQRDAALLNGIVRDAIETYERLSDTLTARA